MSPTSIISHLNLTSRYILYILNGGVCYYSYLLYYYIDTSCGVVSIYNLE